MKPLRLSMRIPPDRPGVAILRIGGDVEYLNVPAVERAFEEMLRTENPRHVLLDLTELTFLVTPFLGSLLFWKDELGKRGGVLALFGIRPEIEGTLRVVRLDRILPFRADEQDALANLPQD